jgi:hypothetical protein
MLLEAYVGDKLIFKGSEDEFRSGPDRIGILRAGEIVKVNGVRRRVIQLVEKPVSPENEERVYIMRLGLST